MTRTWTLLLSSGLVMTFASPAAPGCTLSAASTCTCMKSDDWLTIRREATALFTGVVVADSQLTFPNALASDSALSAMNPGARKVTLFVEHAWKLSARTQRKGTSRDEPSPELVRSRGQPA